MFLNLVVAHYMAYECVGQFHPATSCEVYLGTVGLTATNRNLKNHCMAMKSRGFAGSGRSISFQLPKVGFCIVWPWEAL